LNRDDSLQPVRNEAAFMQNELESVEIDLLLEGIYRAYGFDFRNYLRASLRRRIWNRIQADGLPSITSLLDKALHEPGYIRVLLNDFSIQVTEMFRDPGFFQAFRREVVPHLRCLPEIRIWHAGCSTGEEAYSMAILLDEEGLLGKSKLYATDMNEEAVEQAKRGRFGLKRMQAFTKNYQLAGGTKAFSTYYLTDREHARFHPHLSESIVFAGHNLATDSTFNEFHVILCRNVLIYFDSALQHRTHSLFHESLAEHGFLGLGSKEAIMSSFKKHYEELVPCERIYRKIGR